MHKFQLLSLGIIASLTLFGCSAVPEQNQEAHNATNEFERQQTALLMPLLGKRITVNGRMSSAKFGYDVIDDSTHAIIGLECLPCSNGEYHLRPNEPEFERLIAKENKLIANYPHGEQVSVTGTLCHLTCSPSPDKSPLEKILFGPVVEQAGVSHFFFSVDELSISSVAKNVYANSTIAKGTVVLKRMLDARSGPRIGFASKYLDQVKDAIGRTTVREIKPGDVLTQSDLTPTIQSVSDK